MEINLKFTLQDILGLPFQLRRIDPEILFLVIGFLILVPYLVPNIWVIISSLFWISVQGGFLLSVLALLYAAIFKFLAGRRASASAPSTTDNNAVAGEVKRKCSCWDIVLSVFFQTGLNIPSFLWSLIFKPSPKIPKPEEKIEEVKNVATPVKSGQRVTFAYPENQVFYYDEVSPEHSVTNSACGSEDDESYAEAAEGQMKYNTRFGSRKMSADLEEPPANVGIRNRRNRTRKD